MKLKGLSRSALILVLYFTSQLLHANTEWQETLNQSGIVLSQRTLPGKSYKQIQGHMVIEGRIDSLVSIMNNPGLCPQWLNDCRSSKIVETINLAERVTYTVIDAPFILDDRDLYARSKVSYDKPAKTVTITLHGLENYAPEQEKRVRIKALNGFWQFTQLNDQQVRVRYQLYSNPQISPASVVDTFVPGSMLKTFINLRRLANSPAHKNVRFTQEEIDAITVR